MQNIAAQMALDSILTPVPAILGGSLLYFCLFVKHFSEGVRYI